MKGLFDATSEKNKVWVEWNVFPNQMRLWLTIETNESIFIGRE
jgi:hypothetical protein